jgi:hypothetical protein
VEAWAGSLSDATSLRKDALVKRILWTGLVIACVCVGLTCVPARAASPPAPSPGTSSVITARAPIGPVTLGRVAPTGASACYVGAGGYAWMSNFVDPNNPTYTAPYAGVITSFSNYASATGGRLQALFLAADGDRHYDLVARSDTVTALPNRLNTFPVRIPVRAGQLLALRTIDPNQRCLGTGMLIDQIYGYDFTATQTTFDVVPGGVSQIQAYVNISAVLEPDVDGDGYGDASQDGCPALAAVHDPCPAPVTTIAKAPKKRLTKHKVKFRFAASVAGSTFGCSVDGRAFKACRSPFKGRFLIGTHTVRILATSPVGVPAAAPVTVQFKVVKPKT